MTSQQVYLVRKSFAELLRHDHIAALVFYRRLFELDPSLKPLFKTNIEEQARKLLDMLGLLIAMLEKPVGLDAELRELGARHVGYGVKKEDYTTVGTALLYMLSEVLGKQFSASVREAWIALYTAVAAGMNDGASLH